MSRIERDGLIYDVIIVGNSTIEVLVPDANAEVPAQPTTPSNPNEGLEDTTALLALELAETQLRVDQNEQTTADLILQLTVKGVI